MEVDSLIPGSSGHGEFKTIDSVESVHTAADVSVRWEETKTDKMIIGLFLSQRKQPEP